MRAVAYSACVFVFAYFVLKRKHKLSEKKRFFERALAQPLRPFLYSFWDQNHTKTEREKTQRERTSERETVRHFNSFPQICANPIQYC